MIETSPNTFSANELWTLGIAAYAAFVSTFVLGWDAYKWLASGPKIDMSVSMDMQKFGGGIDDPKTYVLVTATNVGDRPTTITNLGGMYFDSWWHANVVRRRPKKAFIVTEPSSAQRLPFHFDLGVQWMGFAHQTAEIEQMAKDGYLFVHLYTAGSSSRGHRARVRPYKAIRKEAEPPASL